MSLKEDALQYHSVGRPGKIEVVSTKPCVTQRDLSLAYTPGVADPCLEIAKNPDDAYHVHGARQSGRGREQRHGRPRPRKYRSSGGQTGHGGQGCPLQAVRGHRRLRHRGRDRESARRSSACASSSSRPSAGSTSKTSRRPSASCIEETLKKTMGIPVFHDDQHGTAIISGAALLNAARADEARQLDKIRVVVSGAGASGIACAKFYVALGVKRREHHDARHQGGDLQGTQGGDEPVQGDLRARHEVPHARGGARRRRSLPRPLRRRIS